MDNVPKNPKGSHFIRCQSFTEVATADEYILIRGILASSMNHLPQTRESRQAAWIVN